MPSEITKPCTSDCWTGVKHEGTPTGTIENIGGAQTYVALPPAGTDATGIILFYADVYGPMYPNNKLLQDYFASQGNAACLVVLEMSN